MFSGEVWQALPWPGGHTSSWTNDTRASSQVRWDGGHSRSVYSANSV